MTAFSFLEYVGRLPTTELIHEIHRASGMINTANAEMLGIALSTYKGWRAHDDSKNKRMPSQAMLHLWLYELEARRLGFASLFELLKNNLK
jgi:hypothetical protein